MVMCTRPRQGLCAFRERNLHPACALILWLLAAVGAQFLSAEGLLGLGVSVLVLSPKAVKPWLLFARRARWLLLTLWMIMAFNTPGEAFLEWGWAPTYEGVAEANTHVLRLLVFLACLAWLFARLSRDDLVLGVWALLRPVATLGVDVERLVVRLALVLGYVEDGAEKMPWRRMLDSAPPELDGGACLHVAERNWSVRDSWINGSAVAA